MHALLNVAVMAARRAGSALIKKMVNLQKLKVEQKGHNDYVSDADLAAEKAVINCILKHYPDHAILAEESGAQGESDTIWIVDPLDGTTNYLHGFPVFAVSIGVQIKGRMEHAVVYDPLRQELFTATRGQGAHLDSHRIRVSGQKQLERALVGTGFPYRQADDEIDPYMKMLSKVVRGTSGVRRPGAAALDLAYVAAGRLDARSGRHHKWAGRQRGLPRHRPRDDRHAEDLRRARKTLCRRNNQVRVFDRFQQVLRVDAK